MNIKEFGIYIADTRKRQGMTQKDLAEKLHVTPKAVSRWERCVGYPDIENLSPLADALHITIEDLFSCGRNDHDLKEIIMDTAVMDRHSRRVQERAVNGLILCITVLSAFLLYKAGKVNLTGALFFGLLASGMTVSVYYGLMEDDEKGRKVYGILSALLSIAVIGILLFCFG